MFSRSPYRHVPLFPKTPAGFRMFNPPQSCFRPSIFSRDASPRVHSPLGSPAREPKTPIFFDHNAPPTQGLPHIFEPAPFHTGRVGRTPKNPPGSKVFKKSAPTKLSNSRIIHPRRKFGHKRLTYHLTVTRPGLRRKGPRFHSPAKIKREKAAVALDRVEDVALGTMQNGRMTAEDRIFLKQLGELRLDQQRKHTLGDAREKIARAEALGPQRELEHAERDRQAALRVEENAHKKKEEEELCRLEELRRQEEERRLQEEEKLREEEARRRQEESRRRAEERARLREQREHELQAKREAFRKAQEEAECRAREQAQRLREEAERKERMCQEELRRTAAQVDLVAFFQLYNAKWEELRKSKTLTSVMLCEMPWPIFQQGCTSPDDITRRSMEEFIFHPLRPGSNIKSRKDRLKAEVLRFHPDKFNSHIVRKLRECDREKAIEIAGEVARILTNMMTEEIQREKGE